MTELASDKRQHAVMAARDVFWRHGYEEASMTELALHQCQGCYICHVAVKESDKDETIRAAVNEYFDRIIQVIAACLQDAETAGQLNPNLTAEMAARIVFAADLSMGIYIQADGPRERLRDVAKVTMAAISAPGAWTPIPVPTILLPEDLIAGTKRPN